MRDPEVMRLAVSAVVGKEKQKKMTKKGKKEAAPRQYTSKEGESSLTVVFTVVPSFSVMSC